MREFNSIEWFTLRGNPVASVILDKEEVRATMLETFQREGVTVDGVERKVIDVESWALLTIRKGSPIALMLEPLPDSAGDGQ
jgi:hypothetical protein